MVRTRVNVGQGRASRARRFVAIGALAGLGVVLGSVATAPTAGAGLPWWWPTPKPPAATTTTTAKPASGRPILAFQGPDPLVLTISGTKQVVDVVVKNVGPVDDQKSISVSTSGSGSLGVSTGTCSRALKKAGSSGDTCAIRLTVAANGSPGTRTLKVSGGPKATGDTLTVRIVRP